MNRKLFLLVLILVLAVVLVSCGSGIKFSETEKSLMEYEEYSIKPKGVKSGKDIVWSSSNEKVATVDANGIVHAVGIGSATITATADGKTASCSVTVNRLTFPNAFDGAWMYEDDSDIYTMEDIVEMLAEYYMDSDTFGEYKVFSYNDKSFTFTWKFSFNGKSATIALEMKAIKEGSFDATITANVDGETETETEHIDLIKCPEVVYALYDDDVHVKKTVAQFEEFCKSRGVKDFSSEIKKSEEFVKKYFEMSLLEIAMETSSPEVVGFLISNGMDFSDIGDLNDVFDLPKEIVISIVSSDSFDVNATDYWGFTPLLSALYLDEKASAEVVKILLDKGADADKGILWGEGPVSYAIEYCPEEVAIALINASADVSVPDEGGKYPLCVALGKDDKASATIVKLLLEKGADPKKGKIWGSDPISYAKEYCSTEIVNLLIQ